MISRTEVYHEVIWNITIECNLLTAAEEEDSPSELQAANLLRAAPKLPIVPLLQRLLMDPVTWPQSGR